MSENARKILRDVFGYEAFREPQEQVIDHVERGGSALVMMPTGMGKSLCYQLPSRMLDGLTLVISPLIALMKDQVDAARAKGLRAAAIHSALPRAEREGVYRRLGRKEYELLYVTPERFQKPEFREALAENPIALLAVDEAHCISQWGHDFRMDYSRLGEIREGLGHPPTLALTATATPQVQKDILQELRLDSESTPIFQAGLERPNIQLEVMDVHGLDQKVQAFMALRHQHPGSTIVYFSLISTLESFSRLLNSLSIAHFTYHGQQPSGVRRKMQEAFIHGRDTIVLATPAFGLGIDKPDIRLVVHAEIPGSIEAYYQEVGRAGRDGQPSLAFLLYDPDDVSIQTDFIKWANPEPEFVRSVHGLLERQMDKARMDGPEFLRQQMHFYHSRDFRVETTLNLLERWGVLENKNHPKQWSLAESLPEEFLDQEMHEKKLKTQQEKLLEMVRYVTQSPCRKQTIYRYFGVPDPQPCGQCDICFKTAPKL